MCQLLLLISRPSSPTVYGRIFIAKVPEVDSAQSGIKSCNEGEQEQRRDNAHHRVHCGWGR